MPLIFSTSPFLPPFCAFALSLLWLRRAVVGVGTAAVAVDNRKGFPPHCRWVILRNSVSSLGERVVVDIDVTVNDGRLFTGKVKTQKIKLRPGWHGK